MKSAASALSSVSVIAAAWPNVRGEGMKQESKRWLSRALVVAALLGVGVLVWQVSRPTGLG